MVGQYYTLHILLCTATKLVAKDILEITQPTIHIRHSHNSYLWYCYTNYVDGGSVHPIPVKLLVLHGRAEAASVAPIYPELRAATTDDDDDTATICLDAGEGDWKWDNQKQIRNVSGSLGGEAQLIPSISSECYRYAR